MEKALKKYFPLFVLPGFICFTVAFLMPMALGLVLPFCEFTSVASARWIGLENHALAFAFALMLTRGL